MISDIFFSGKIVNVKDVLLYDEDFVVFYLKKSLKHLEEFSKEDVENLLYIIYDKRIIKNNRIAIFCEKYFISKGKKYYIEFSDEEKNYFDSIKEFSYEIEKNDLFELSNTIENDIFNKEIEFCEKLKKCIIYFGIKDTIDKYTKIKILYYYYQVLNNFYKFYRIIDTKLENIPELFNSIEITELDFQTEKVNLLVSNNVCTLKNLKLVPIDILIVIFCDNIQAFLEEISKYAITKTELLLNVKNKIKIEIKPEWDNVLKRRFDVANKNKRTLAEIGKELNLTRERIRQIENNAIRKLLFSINDVSRMLECFYNDINKSNNYYITIDEFKEYFWDDELVLYFLMLINFSEMNLKFNEENWIIYNSKEIEYEEILKEAKEQMSNIISKSDIEKYNIIQKNIIRTDYRLYQDTVYVNRDVNISYIYISEIKDNFIDGYDIGKIEDYNKLIEIIKTKYGDIEVSSMISIQAMLERNDFVQIDRGRYKAREYSAVISNSLFNDILTFIINNQPVVAYGVIFEKFKLQLEKLGIDNRYYLKGCIDEKLPDEFKTNRDYINTDSDESYTPYDAIRKVFQSFDNYFTIDDAKEKMPGLKGYNYENYAKAEEKNGLIQLGSKTYIYLEKLGIDENIKKELEKYINTLFEQLDSNIITSKKIYASLNIMNRQLFNCLNIPPRFGDFALFSIIQYFFKDKYYFSRPLISNEECFITTSYMLVKEYAKRLKLFSYNDIKKYIYKMNFSVIPSYLSFMDALSDEYIQISKDSMIRKEELEIREEQLKRIEDFMDLLLKNNEIRTNDFDGYFMLPRLARSWNKYLLVGIIKTYFREKYDIQNTTNYYDTTDFIIRRIN